MSGLPANRDLPKVPPPAELNRLLLLLRDLDQGEGVTKTALFEGMSALSLGGLLPDNETTLAFASRTGLVTRSRSRWYASDAGRALMAANPDSLYEPTREQHNLLYHYCVESGPYRRLACQVMGAFRMAPDADTWRLVPSDPAGLDHVGRSLVSFMIALGVLSLSDVGLEVSGPHVPHVSQLRSKRIVTSEELLEALRRQREQGAKGEEWVLKYERSRLRAAGCPAEAAAVRHISPVDVCAGYDVASFDGPSAAMTFDRLIEVKTTVSASFAFFWSSNEIATARELGPTYWLYLVRLTSESHAELVRVRNPVSRIGAPGGVTLEPSEYRCVVSVLELERIDYPESDGPSPRYG